MKKAYNSFHVLILIASPCITRGKDFLKFTKNQAKEAGSGAHHENEEDLYCRTRYHLILEAGRNIRLNDQGTTVYDAENEPNMILGYQSESSGLGTEIEEFLFSCSPIKKYLFYIEKIEELRARTRSVKPTAVISPKPMVVKTVHTK